MKIFVKRSGGLANLGPIQGEVDTSELPPDLAAEVQREINPEKLQVAAKPKNLQMTDAQQITVGLQTDSGYTQFELDEASTDPDVFDLANELVNQVVRKKMGKKA